MESSFWHDRWRSGGTLGFDQDEPNRQLIRFWDAVGCPPGAAVFVPLCGRSVDMTWLAGRGHRVVGVELSEVAVADFLRRQNLLGEVDDPDGHDEMGGPRPDDALTVHAAGPYELWCGDLFDLGADALDGVAAVYDRAALVALPPDLRRRYARHLIEIVPPTAAMLLLTFRYDQETRDGPPFAVHEDEIEELYGHRYTIEELPVGDAVDEPVRRAVSLLRPRR